MMRKMIWALALALLLPVVGHTQVYDYDTYILATSWDVDGEAADNDQVVIVGNGGLTDSKTFTLTANPDVCRLVDITVTDADSSITAGVLTVVGTDCWGNALTATFTFAAGGSGVKTLVVGTPNPPSSNMASGAYFKTVTSVTTGVLTGEGVGDTVIVGYTSNSQYAYQLHGIRVDLPIPPYRYVDITHFYNSKVQVKQGSTSTTITAVTAGTNPFANLAVGDIIGVSSVQSVTMPVQWREILVRTDADNITVDTPVSISPNAGTTGQGFIYKKEYTSSDPQDGWIGVTGRVAVDFLWQETTTGANTGGLVSNVECRMNSTSPSYPSFQIDTDTVNSGATGGAVSNQDLRLVQYDQCRFGLKFGTGDDADATAAATESVFVNVGLRR